MFHKRAHIGLLIVLLIAAVVIVPGCKKLSINRLKANYWFSRANSQFTEGAFRQAITEYERALQYDPMLVQAYRFLGEAYKGMYKPAVEGEENRMRAEKALEALLKAYEIEPHNKDIIYSLGDMYNKLRDYKKAEEFHLKIVELEPTDMSNYYIVAEFYKQYSGSDDAVVEEGEKTPFEKALEMYLRRIETDPDNEQGYAYIAQFFENIQPPSVENFNKAYQYHLMRTDLDSENKYAWTSIGVNRWGVAYRLQNELSREERMRLAKEGEAALMKAKDLDPTYPEPYSWLAVIYKSVLSKIDPDRALRYEEMADRYIERFQEARKRAAARKELEEELGEIR